MPSKVKEKSQPRNCLTVFIVGTLQIDSKLEWTANKIHSIPEIKNYKQKTKNETVNGFIISHLTI